MADSHAAEFSDLLKEDRTFPPPASFKTTANARDTAIYAEAERDPEAFWAGFAKELEWSKPWTKVLDWQPPNARWFVGGKTNLVLACVDRHAEGPLADREAVVGEADDGTVRRWTYRELRDEVNRAAGWLRHPAPANLRVPPVRIGRRPRRVAPSRPEIP